MNLYIYGWYPSNECLAWVDPNLYTTGGILGVKLKSIMGRSRYVYLGWSYPKVKLPSMGHALLPLITWSIKSYVLQVYEVTKTKVECIARDPTSVRKCGLLFLSTPSHMISDLTWVIGLHMVTLCITYSVYSFVLTFFIGDGVFHSTSTNTPASRPPQ